LSEKNTKMQYHKLMLKTHEITIGRGFRIFYGFLGTVVLITALPLAVREIWLALQGEWVRLLTGALLLFISAGGWVLVRAAWRGKIAVRSYGRRQGSGEKG
jgi:hypothetical protein